MPYHFFQVVGLEKPADLRRARQALLACHEPNVTCWVDPLDQLVWMERPDQPFGDDQLARTARQLNNAGFAVAGVDQSRAAGPACIALHRRRRIIEIRNSLILTLLIGLPVILLHVGGHWLTDGGSALLVLGWAELLLVAALLTTAGRRMLWLGLFSLHCRRWRWRTGVAVAVIGSFGLSLLDLLIRTSSTGGLTPIPATRTLCGPIVVILAVVLLRAMLIRWRMAQLSRPFDTWLAAMSPADEQRLRLHLRTQNRHQRIGWSQGPGRLADRFPTLALMAVAAMFVAVLAIGGRILPAWLVAAGLLLVIDPRMLQFAWLSPEVLAERQAVGMGILYGDPRVFRNADRLDTIVFDKSGTVTTAPAEIAEIQLNPLAALDVTEDDLLQLAASVHHGWGHVEARSLLEAVRQRDLPLLDSHNVQFRPGMGIAGEIAERHIRVGSEFYLLDEGIDLSPFASQIETFKRQPFTLLLVSIDAQVAGGIALTDTVRPGSEQAVSELARTMEVRLFTGDSAVAGAQLAAHLGIPQVFVELRPQAKIELLSRWRSGGKRVAVVVPLDADPQLPGTACVGIGLAGGLDEMHYHPPESAEAGGQDHPTAHPLSWQPDVLVLDEQIERIPTAIALAGQVRRQRRRGYAWAATLLVVASVTAVLAPMHPAIAEWAPPIVVSLTLAGLPAILQGNRV